MNYEQPTYTQAHTHFKVIGPTKIINIHSCVLSKIVPSLWTCYAALLLAREQIPSNIVSISIGLYTQITRNGNESKEFKIAADNGNSAHLTEQTSESLIFYSISSRGDRAGHKTHMFLVPACCVVVVVPTNRKYLKSNFPFHPAGAGVDGSVQSMGEVARLVEWNVNSPTTSVPPRTHSTIGRQTRHDTGEEG